MEKVKDLRLRNSLVLAGLCAIVGLTTTLALRASRPSLPVMWTLPPFEMVGVTTQGEHPLRLSDLSGQVWIANFIYTNCSGPCPLLSQKMAQLQKRLPREIKLLSFTVDPDYDTPKVLQAYAFGFGADPARWQFVRGSKAALYKLAYEGFHTAVVQDPSAPEGFRVVHSTKLVLVDRQGRVRKLYDSSDEDLYAQMERDSHSLLKEKV